MGRKQREIRVIATLSDHNSEQDEIDENLFRELAAEIRHVAEQPKYDDILALVEEG